MAITKWYQTKTCRLMSMLALTFSFFLVEIVFGYVTNSLALVSDSYHMLSDVVALAVGIASVRISKMNSHKNTYGWARAEVLGALINSVFLVALCFTIFVEAIQRLSHTDEIHHSDWMLYVGIAGLVINLLGLLLFHQHSHGHSHGGHGHSHGHADADNKSDPAKSKESAPTDTDKVSLSNVRVDDRPTLDMSRSMEQNADESDDSQDADNEDVPVNGPGEIKRKKIKSGAQLNMRGVFLHVLGDALGSVVVIVSALIIRYSDVWWRFKVDPAMSMLMVIIIMSTTIPLLKESALILMQTVPTHIQVADLKKKLINSVEGVLAVHEFHIWQLAGNRIIASAHIRCLNLRDYMRIAEEVKSFFHNEGIHSTTIQPEFVEGIYPVDHQHSNHCLLDCLCKDEMKCCRSVPKFISEPPSPEKCSINGMLGSGATGDPLEKVSEGSCCDGGPVFESSHALEGKSPKSGKVRWMVGGPSRSADDLDNVSELVSTTPESTPRGKKPVMSSVDVLARSISEVEDGQGSLMGGGSLADGFPTRERRGSNMVEMARKGISKELEDIRADRIV